MYRLSRAVDAMAAMKEASCGQDIAADSSFTLMFWSEYPGSDDTENGRRTLYGLGLWLMMLYSGVEAG